MISTVISFSTLETRFIGALIRETEKFCDDIIIVAYDHFFDGTPEQLSTMQELRIKYPQTRWLINSWNPEQTSKYWHNFARWSGAEISKYTRILFLDGDEIPDGDLMKRWLQYEPLDASPLHMFECFWYFREPFHQATKPEYCGLLANMNQLKKEMFFTHYERWFFRIIPNVQCKVFCNMNGNVIFNHYSWVRTKDEMLHKVTGWAHKNDRPWSSLVEEEFTHPFNGKDFVHGYSYRHALNIFDL